MPIHFRTAVLGFVLCGCAFSPDPSKAGGAAGSGANPLGSGGARGLAGSFGFGGSSAFSPPYPYTLESTSSLASAVMSGAGPK